MGELLHHILLLAQVASLRNKKISMNHLQDVVWPERLKAADSLKIIQSQLFRALTHVVDDMAASKHVALLTIITTHVETPR